MLIKIEKELSGTILDIGGGGEGVISRVYPGQVIAIDNREEELEEAPEGPVKIVMDAASMTFTKHCFMQVTAFYCFMYMNKSEHPAVIAEIKRVLQPEGRLYLWDAVIEKADPFITELTIEANGTLLETTYGVGKKDGAQDSAYYKNLLGDAGFRLIHEEIQDGHFYQCWEKQVNKN